MIKHSSNSCNCVAPFTGAWIEIFISKINANAVNKVAPFTGAWIEIEWIAESLPVKNGHYYKQDYYSAETNQQAVFYFDDSDKLVMIQFPFVSMH